MLFSEVYGNYFNAIAAVLTRAAEGGLTGKELTAIVQEAAFGESLLTIPAALTDGRWPLLEKDLSTRLHHAPSMPLTALQKQWLKALLQDPRIRLFAPSEKGLEDAIWMEIPTMTKSILPGFGRYCRPCGKSGSSG